MPGLTPHKQTPETVPELVVLCDDADRPIGTAEKELVHTANTPLHQAFSLFLFNPKGELLLQQRSHLKKTWPLEWSNSCCGHPLPAESRVHAAHRRVRAELGCEVLNLRLELPDYRYHAENSGIVENEICPVFTGLISGELQPDPLEVEAVRWIGWEVFCQQVSEGCLAVSPWCIEETRLLVAKGFHPMDRMS
ncbi:MAG: isopentenyl-diphosphate Delta-isomerase [Armatimonadota bacterium]